MMRSVGSKGEIMILGSPVPARVLLVDDDLQHLELCAQVMKVRGFSVITAPGPMEAMSILAETIDIFDIAVIDYHMPIMNGCLLADRLKLMCPEMKIILRSGAVAVPESEMTNIDAFIPKSGGIAPLITWVSNIIGQHLNKSLGY
jgi:DNA-binding NtrC family response regulator